MQTINGLELVEGDRVMFGVDIVEVARVSRGFVQRTGERFAFVDYTDGTGHCFGESSPWFVTIFAA